MKLHWSPRSPFVRKVMITLHETGRLDEVELMRNVVAAHLPPNPAVLADNPLGKIPALVTDDGVLFDSRVICAYLDRDEVLPDGPRAQTWAALADGATDILLAWRTELSRPIGPWAAITGSYLVKIRAVMAHLEAEVGSLTAAPFGPGHVALVCFLGQLDFRWPDCAWRDHFPGLAALAADWAARPSVAATAVVDDGTGDNALTAGILTFAKETT
ncbi:glutathione S-transferase [Mangrovicoccus algicola]|uniref:Glutathione S-transferase N-terminal domain-containing protein n=1 Tax=Mangrovicoccus algicola TaxID=2771008 RepID=A0A8J6Z9I1_9RHOB|nr:glutathione S-transferase N-terminal domain-containing protein [Mangrovicoccus algicola]MBE3638795.1 glutathione S-transferase N-terminal domain-containing protein [Mangrovicoccus algicola]